MSLTLILYLNDANDNAPRFHNLPDTVTFNEDTDLQTVLFTADASDADSYANKNFEFSIISVIPESGLVSFVFASQTNILSILLI